MVKGIFNSPPVFNKKIKVCLRWHENPPTFYVVSCKKLRDEGLHTFLGMVGYCMKENGEEHFEFMRHCVGNDMNKGKTEYANFKKVDLNNCVSLSYSNIISMGMVSYEEEFGYYYCGSFVSYVQEWAILSERDLNPT